MLLIVACVAYAAGVTLIVLWVASRIDRSNARDVEFRDPLLNELYDHITQHMDQWDNWRMPTPHGTAYISISVEPPPGWEPEHYDWVLPDPSRSSR